MRAGMPNFFAPRWSVTNPFSQLWDCPNVIVADGAAFVSNPFKNPTLTIMALAWRACDRLREWLRDGSIRAPA
jgi:choline dehydrogenase-like flavoprotein